MEAHRDAFAPLTNINYEQIARDLSIHVRYDIPSAESKFSHIYRANGTPRSEPKASYREVTESQSFYSQNFNPTEVAPPKAQPKESTRRGPNMEALKNTLSSLMEEKINLEQRLNSAIPASAKEELQFDYDLVQRNIATVQEKIRQA